MIEDKNIKQKIKNEIQVFAFYVVFLTFFLGILTTYQRLILGEYSISYMHYGYGLIEALILSKIIMIGQYFKLGEKFIGKPLIVPVLYKAVIFSVLVLLFTILEHFVIGYLHGGNSAMLYQEFLNKGLDETLAKVLVVFFVFILFFSFIEIARLVGKGRLVALFFTPRKK